MGTFTDIKILSTVRAPADATHCWREFGENTITFMKFEYKPYPSGPLAYFFSLNNDSWIFWGFSLPKDAVKITTITEV